jgi:hypothetical protein
LRLTLPHVEVTVALAAFDKASPNQRASKYSLTTSKSLIKAHWHAAPVFMGDLKCLAALATLSAATSGQSLVPIDFLFDAMLIRRKDPMEPREMQYEDVITVIDCFYKAANALGSKWPETIEHKGMGKHGARKKTYGKAKAQEKKAAEEARDDEELGEDAALAAKPSLKGGEMDRLAGMFEKKGGVKDNEMVENGEDEEDAVR